MNLFASDEFLSSLAEIYYYPQKFSTEYYKLGGKIYRLLVINGEKIVTSFPFLEYFEPVKKLEDATNKKISYLPRAVLAVKKFDHQGRIPPEDESGLTELAPYIDLSIFKNPAEYWHTVYQGNHDFLVNTRRRIRKLAIEIGQPHYEFSSSDHSLIDRCLTWKSCQLDKFGGSDLFFDTRHSKFFKLLMDKGLLVASSLSAGGKLIAVNIGAQYDKIYYGSICAYDLRFSAYAPGRLLLHYDIEECIRRKFRQFDFLLGSEEYKWKYVTHYRIIGPAGIPPVSEKLKNNLIRLRLFARSRFPGIYYRLKKIVITSEKFLHLVDIFSKR